VAALTEVRVPDIGDFDAVPVIEVLVSPGDTVAAEDPLIVLESDKASMEVPSPAAGVVGEMSVSVGDEVSEGDLILTLTPEDGGDADAEPEAVEAAEPTVEAKAEAEAATTAGEPGEDQGGEPDAGTTSDPAAAGQEETQAAPVEQTPPPPAAAGDGGRTESVYAGPGTRALARELGVDLSAVAGTGHKGRVTREDVTAAAEGGGAPGAAPAKKGAKAPVGAAPSAPAGLPAWPQVDFAAFGPVEREPLSRIARIAGPALARNWAMIPHVTQFDEADITALEAFRKEVNAAHAAEGVKVTMVALMVKACAAALRAFPHFNASLDGDALVLKGYCHIGFAADTDAGLMVPVIRDADRKGLLEIARELTTLSAAARDGSITADQMKGGTFTISSLGGIGGTAFTPIINAPEVAILGVSRSAMQPVWDGTAFRPRLMLPLSLSYDHRVIDGAAAARFTTHLTHLLSDPRQMLL
jgi:pyruvate dehydrogenase E2 component (dihydrolipoamide acetyltransferase)